MNSENKFTQEMQQVEISKLVPYANNSRTHNEKQIKKLQSSLREFGFVNPILIDRDFNIIAGHGRVFAAKEDGIKTVPCVFVDHLTEAQKKAYIIADNRLAEDAGWDKDLLSIELENLKELDFDVDLLGFDAAELNTLLNSAEDVKEDNFDVEEELKNPNITEQGDVWILGRHKLM